MNNVPDRIQTLADKLRSRGQRLTPQRMAVLKVLVSSPSHPDVDSIYQQVKDEFPMTSLATIYKTLATLKEIGEVREIELSATSSRFDAANPRPHSHLVCIKCDKIMDVEVGDVLSLSGQVAEQSGYQLIDYRLDFFGICPICQTTPTSSESSTTK